MLDEKQMDVSPSTVLFPAVRPMMYGYGDADQPLPESVDLVEVEDLRYMLILFVTSW